MTLEQIWQALQLYNGEGSKNFDLSGTRVQLYKGAMEIPLIAFHASSPYDLSEEKIEALSDLLAQHGFELDCVEDNRNYKINRSEDGQYLGRITLEALKLHVERSKELGWNIFKEIAEFPIASEIS